MDVMKYLKKSGAKYEMLKHKPAFTAQRMAAVEHEPGKYVAKPVIVKVDGEYVMCVLPASCKIDLRALKSAVGAKKVELANEEDMAGLFGDCELGAEPPFGNLYDLPTVMDKSLEADDHIMFQAGSHERAVRMSMSDYRKLAEPKVLEFSYHTT
ncbi:MAG: aminoacyl-tRNA deacylase [Planctomycetota bacterium]|jgi:Ala-tRNA(Pro) deacylase